MFPASFQSCATISRCLNKEPLILLADLHFFTAFEVLKPVLQNPHLTDWFSPPVSPKQRTFDRFGCMLKHSRLTCRISVLAALFHQSFARYNKGCDLSKGDAVLTRCANSARPINGKIEAKHLSGSLASWPGGVFFGSPLRASSTLHVLGLPLSENTTTNSQDLQILKSHSAFQRTAAHEPGSLAVLVWPRGVLRVLLRLGGLQVPRDDSGVPR